MREWKDRLLMISMLPAVISVGLSILCCPFSPAAAMMTLDGRGAVRRSEIACSRADSHLKVVRTHGVNGGSAEFALPLSLKVVGSKSLRKDDEN